MPARKDYPQSFTHATENCYVERGFYPQAADLRLQLEEHLSLSIRDSAGLTPLAYVFSENRYSFLTASAESIFAEETLRDLIDSLNALGQERFGASHVSTPQLRVYVNGCSREVLRDDVMLGWHYKFSLTPSDRYPSGGRVRIVTGRNTEDKNSNHFSISDFMSSRVTLNELLVHDTQCAYGVETVKSSMNPLEGAVFLDGYLW